MPFVIAFIVAVAAFMGWKLLQPQCPGGAVVADEQQCRAQFDAAFCGKAWPEALTAARTQGGAYATQAQCLDKFPACIPRSDVPAWTPRPNGYCIARGPDGEVAHVEPVYAIR
ncbi:MAG: DUF1190 domain-containing protein [Rhodoblastus sp.]|jgi:uncharacterized protein YgiB involved in biofilm formation